MLDLAVVVTTHTGQIEAGIFAGFEAMAPAEIHIVSSNEKRAGRLDIANAMIEVYHHEELLKPGAARNFGASKTSAGSLLFLDHDVLVTEPGHQTIRAFVGDDRAQLVGGLYLIDPKETAAQNLQNSFLAYRFDQCQASRKSVLSTSHLLVKREAFDRIGGFHEVMTSQEDLEFCSRAIDLGLETRLDRGFLAVHKRPFSGRSLVGDYFRKSRASIGTRLSNRRATRHGGNNLSRALVLSFLAPVITAFLVAVLLATGVTQEFPYALLAIGVLISQPWRFYGLYLGRQPRLLAYAVVLWPWIGLAVTAGSVVGGAQWLRCLLLRKFRSGLDYLIALKRVLIRDGTPIQVIAYCTAICNLRCGHCFYKETLDRPSRGELSFAVFERLIRDTKPLLWFSLGGGEPFLRSDLLELSKCIVGLGRPKLFSFPTNGWFTEETYRYALRLLQSHPDGSTQIALFVSIDGPEDVHDGIRGPGSYRRALATIARLRPLESWYPHFHVNVVTTITEDNAAQAESFVGDILRVVGPSSLAINLFRYHALEHPPLDRAVIEGYERALAIHETWRETNQPSGFGFWTDRVLRIKERLQKEIILRVARNNEYVTPCTAGQLSWVVMEDGRLKSCEILSSDVGNVVENDMKTLTRSPEAADLRDWIRDTRCRCTYECANSANALFSWPMTWKSLKSLVSLNGV